MSAVRFLRNQKCENGNRYREEVLSIDEEDRALLAQSVPLVVDLLRSPRLQGVLSMLAKELLGEQSTRSGRQEVREFLRTMGEEFPTIVIDYELSKDEPDTYGYTPEVELEEGSGLGNVMIRINGKRFRCYRRSKDEQRERFAFSHLMILVHGCAHAFVSWVDSRAEINSNIISNAGAWMELKAFGGTIAFLHASDEGSPSDDCGEAHIVNSAGHWGELSLATMRATLVGDYRFPLPASWLPGQGPRAVNQEPRAADQESRVAGQEGRGTTQVEVNEPSSAGFDLPVRSSPDKARGRNSTQ